jgi:hypothetical protein
MTLPAGTARSTAARKRMIPDAMLRHTSADDGPGENVQCREQGGRAISLVIMGHGPAFPRLQRQARLGAVERQRCHGLAAKMQMVAER